MSDHLATVRRSIAREEALRASGTEPSPFTVEQTVDFICSHRELLADDDVRRYLVARASTSQYHVASKLLDLIIPLHEQGHDEDALRCFRSLAHIGDSTLWDPKSDGFYRSLEKKAFEEVLGHAELLVEHPWTWGTLSIELFSALLAATWSSEWDLGARPTDEERYPPEWIVGRYRSRLDARWHVAQAVRSALQRSAGAPTGEAFRILTDDLLRVPYSIALNMILEALYDALRSSPQAWHVPTAVRVLTLPRVGRSRSTYDLRRLVRRVLPDDVTRSDRDAILQAIRESDGDEFRRRNELADIEPWGVLSAEEADAVEEARIAGELFPPRDPREAPRVRVERETSDSWSESQASRWPYPEDHPLLRTLQQRAIRQPSDTVPDFDADLGPRLEALRITLGRPEAFRDEWLGTFLEFCEQAIGDLKKWYLSRCDESAGGRGLTAEELQRLLETHAPWWDTVARAAVARLGEPLPSEHERMRTDLLSWGSGDPVYEALQYVDELLAVDRGEPFDSVRQELARVISSVWALWPSYTRATALAVLRPYHWATVPGLAENIDQTLAEEHDAHVLKWCLEALLRSSDSIAERLDHLIHRIASLPGMSEVANQVGQVIGDAVIRSRGDREPWTELRGVAALAEEFASGVEATDEFRLAFASGLLWGGYSRLNQVPQLTELHARCWLPLANWAIGVSLEPGPQDDNERIPLQPVMAVLELRWPSSLSTEIYSKLADVLERIIREGALSTFFDLHYHLNRHLKGDELPTAPAIPDELLIRLCRASARRIADWAAEGKTTNDWGFAGTVSGRETGELMKLAFEHATARELLRRELAPLIDLIADAGRTWLATELRLQLRRG